jgi:hypothetical protein
MRLFPPTLTIDDTEGFVPEKDIFGRVIHGKRLSNLMAVASEPLVIAVDGQWGTGKTTFLKMWAGELRKNHFPVIFFDAYENDYVEDAFTALASQIIALAQERKKASTKAGKKFVASAINAGKVLVRSGLKVGVKAATIGALDAADFNDIANELGSEAATLTDKYVGELLTKQKQQKEAIAAFREALAELPALLSAHPSSEVPGETASASKPRPLVFIIDELDRCRPAFALDLLERIKHFFSVQNVHFVLGTHFGQLTNSVVVAYGPNIDAGTYLQKFIHLTFFLIDRGEHRHERTSTKFLNYLTKAMEFPGTDDIRSALSLVRFVTDRRDLSLRAIERIMTMLAIAYSFTTANTFRPPPLVAGLCVIKVIAPSVYAKAKRGTLDWDEVLKILALNELAEPEDEHAREWWINWWRYATDPALEEEKQAEFGRSLLRYNFRDRSSLLPFVANDVLDRMVAETK